MIARIKGTVIEKLADRVIVDVAGLGYEVSVAADDWRQISEGEPVSLAVYEQLRDDTHNLYGFSRPETKEFFINLIAVNGVGPKVAMAILSAASLDNLQRAVLSGDPALLQGVAGVGKKTASRIIVELKGKIGGLEGASTGLKDDSAYQALLGLGYSASQAVDAITKLPSDLTDDQARIKAALKEVSK